ncbi:ATP-binding cassette, subfamily B [Tissierella praeacuta DSM 18095]|uniref:ATP-binding cassette, subfamily B n=1 Tax=Tissierella praeacuta DSM 18095 TaxID=1123404 RepID=A0A1M4YC95_9FIRM|nr:ABC transporter ATP-binding protein [Tissierella praeacuta]SHF03424.1 ATP-binding cassette, subfamily B [Tissierella praeacuta DSM 18095]SUP03190.1 Putative multidrug export ATP-binding/permease protein SAV1866 [Tissierella praeacuta]
MIKTNNNQDKIEISTWKNFFKYLKPYRNQFFILSIMMIFLGILDSIFPLMTKYAIDNFIEKNTLVGIEKFGIVYFSAVIMLALTVYLFISLAGKLETKMAYDIRKIGFEKLQLLPLSYYDNKAIGWLMARMTSDISRLSETISWSLVDLAWGFSMMLFITIAMIKLNFKLALITLSVIPILAFVSFYFQNRILKAQRDVRKINSKITAAYNEDIQGAKTTKTLVREDINLQEFSEITKSMKDKSIRATIISSVYLPIILTLASVGTALALNYGGKGVLLGTISYGTLVAFISYTAQFYEPVRQIAVIFAELLAAQASAERVFSLLNEIPEIVDSKEVVAKYGDLLNPKKELWPEIKGAVEFKNVSFSYKDGETILDNFNLKVNPGETIALVGETGSGKSTIVNLFCRFYEPTDGEILIDDINYKNMPQNWIHENLGYVLQSPHLFSGTIKENIRYSNLEATDEEIIAASKLVDAHNFIMDTEKGYDTEVGEGGGLLSTGQKQLISFARAVVRNPKLFVLDEATSSIDTETEKVIQDAIHKVLDGRTSFVIAHRLSTIRNANRILVIKDGKIEESGNHKELIKKKGYYYNLYTNQFIEEKSMDILG